LAADIDEPVHRIATKSAQAFALYSQTKLTAEKPQEIALGLQKALEYDPQFGLAHKYLFTTAYRNTHLEDKVRSYQKALDVSTRMSERERLLLHADFFVYYKFLFGHKILSESTLPASALAQLGPKESGKALEIFERLGFLYPDFYGNNSYLNHFARLYEEREEWDKAIAALQKGMISPQTQRAHGDMLIRCYRAIRQFDQAEKLMEDISRAVKIDYENNRMRLALDRGRYDDFLGYLKKQVLRPGQKSFPYNYYGEIAYVDWLRDDFAAAEKAYQTVEPTNPADVYQKEINLAALCLAKGTLNQGIDHLKKGLQLSGNVKDPAGSKGREKSVHWLLALFYRLAGRLPEALKEAEEACRDCWEPSFSPRDTAKYLHLRALVNLEMNRPAEFERQLEEIKAFSEQERFPKIMRTYDHLLGLKELRENHLQKAIEYFSLGLDLSKPQINDRFQLMCLDSMAEAFMLQGRDLEARRNCDEIEAPGAKESWSGDIYARSFYRKAKCYEINWYQWPVAGNQAKMSAIEAYKKFLSLWENADPIFPEVEDARKRLAKLLSPD